MKPSRKPLSDTDFPMQASGDKVLCRNGILIATAATPDLARDIAERLNHDQEKRHEENWSA